MKTIALGMVGAGRWSQACIRTITGLPGVRLVRIARRRPITDDLAPHSAEIVTDVTRVTRAADIDAVVIVTPPDAHAEAALDAIRHGKPVMVEKPLTANPAEARAILAEAQARPSLVFVDHVHLFHPAFRELKRHVQELGTPLSIRTVAGKPSERTGATVLWDWGPHDIAMCIDLLGEAPNEAASSVRARPTSQVVDVDLAFPGGASASIQLTCETADPVRRFLVQGSRGAILYDDWADVKLRRVAPGVSITGYLPPPGEPIPVASSERPLSAAFREFTAAVRDGQRDIRQLELGVRVVETIHRALG